MKADVESRALDAAVAILEAGEELTLSRVAARAGVARGTLYRRFRDLDALREALAGSRRVAAERLRDLDTRVLDAVGELLKAKGLAATTLEEVARQAGISPVTVYRRFGDRKGVLQTFVARRTPRRLADEHRIAPGRDLEADLTRIARECLTFMGEYRELFLLAFSRDTEAIELLGDLREGSTSMRETVARCLKGRIPLEAEHGAIAFLGMVVGLGWLLPDQPLEARARLAVSVFLKGVLT